MAYTYTAISRSRTLSDQFKKWRVAKGTCSISKMNKVPAATPYTNMACHPGDTWYAVERPLPPPMMPVNPYLSSQGSNLNVLGIPNTAHSTSMVPINRHTQEVIPNKSSSSVNAEKPCVSTTLRLDSGPADWEGTVIGCPGGTLDSFPTGTNVSNPLLKVF
jgi:hypothetical protein